VTAASENSGVRAVCALTGAQGYVGSQIHRALERTSWQVVSLSRRPARNGDTIQWRLDDAQPLADELHRRSVSALVHAAWDFSHTRRSDIERVNVRGSVRLMDEALAGGVRRIVFISTMSAYPGARSLYGRSKLIVENEAADRGAVVLRPGLVYGQHPGGVFGALQHQVTRSRIIPLIGNGSYPQYLVHEDDVGAAVVAALACSVPPGEPVSVAHPQPWPLRRIIEEIATAHHRQVALVPTPVRLVLAGLRAAETVGLRSGFRSDSLVSLVHPNPRPDFNCVRHFGFEPRPYDFEW